MDTRETCDKSMACICSPVAVHSKFVSVTSSLMDSMTFCAQVGPAVITYRARYDSQLVGRVRARRPRPQTPQRGAQDGRARKEPRRGWGSRSHDGHPRVCFRSQMDVMHQLAAQGCPRDPARLEELALGQPGFEHGDKRLEYATTAGLGTVRTGRVAGRRLGSASFLKRLAGRDFPRLGSKSPPATTPAPENAVAAPYASLLPSPRVCASHKLAARGARGQSRRARAGPRRPPVIGARPFFRDYPTRQPVEEAMMASGPLAGRLSIHLRAPRRPGPPARGRRLPSRAARVRLLST